jgi:hypothetical protein
MLIKSFFLTILFLSVIMWGGLCDSYASGDHVLSLSYRVTADPGQTNVPLYLVVTSITPVAGVDAYLQFDREIIRFGGVEFLTRFQYARYDTTVPGKLKITLRRHHPDSTSLGPLAAGTDTLGVVRMKVTSADLLGDVETEMSFWENPLTPYWDNRLVNADSSFVEPPALILQNGSVFVRHPLYGDVNDDGYPNTIADVIFLVNSLMGSQSLTPRQRANSDVNRDGVQGSMTDFLELIRIVGEE